MDITLNEDHTVATQGTRIYDFEDWAGEDEATCSDCDLHDNLNGDCDGRANCVRDDRADGRDGVFKLRTKPSKIKLSTLVNR